MAGCFSSALYCQKPKNFRGLACSCSLVQEPALQARRFQIPVCRPAWGRISTVNPQCSIHEFTISEAYENLYGIYPSQPEFEFEFRVRVLGGSLLGMLLGALGHEKQTWKQTEAPEEDARSMGRPRSFTRTRAHPPLRVP